MWNGVGRKTRDWRLEIGSASFNLQSPISNLFLLFMLIPLIGCASVDPVIKIGLVGPFEGQQRPIGYDVIYSARLAVREINAAGGIDGHRVALVALDDSADPELAMQTAASLTIDPAVVAVVGHWQTETTTAAAPIYQQANLPFIPMGQPPFGEYDPGQLAAEFQQAYEAVTPFAETAGPYAGSTYDAFQLLFHTLELGKENGQINRESVANGLAGLEYEGLTGTVYLPVSSSQ
ncbi:MAG: ABC transporter substrate-binding protein [Chloroflexi bacterium]|nr:ABC transporter substrate-binding protein [Chloroflexota bacterium]